MFPATEENRTVNWKVVSEDGGRLGETEKKFS
jgi:hypothetical protein